MGKNNKRRHLRGTKTTKNSLVKPLEKKGFAKFHADEDGLRQCSKVQEGAERAQHQMFGGMSEGLGELLEAEEGSIYDNNPELEQYVFELKAAGVTLQQFREQFSRELSVIEVKRDVKISFFSDGEESLYTGPVLAVQYHGKDSSPECFPFPAADDPDAPVPPDVFNSLACYWV